MSLRATTAISRWPATAAVSDLLADISNNGVVIIDRLLHESTVAKVNAEIDPVIKAQRLGRNDTPVVSQGRRMNSALRHSPTLVKHVVAHPALMSLVTPILTEYAETVQLSATQIADIGPGESAQLLHRDDYTWGHVTGRTHPLSVVAIIALSEFRSDYGATRVIPGSHRWSDAFEPSTSRNWRGGVYLEKSYPPGVHEELTQQQPMQAGSAIVQLGTTVHGAGQNTSADVYRRALVIQYCVGWIRAAQNNFLLYPPAVAKHFPLEVQRLLGYQLEANHCGQLEQGIDPIMTLRG